jgi:hypothetical protein
MEGSCRGLIVPEQVSGKFQPVGSLAKSEICDMHRRDAGDGIDDQWANSLHMSGG